MESRSASERPDWVVVTKYLIGEETPEESARVERWACAAPDRRSAVAVLREWWRPRPQVVDDAARVDAALAAVLQRSTLTGPMVSDRAGGGVGRVAAGDRVLAGRFAGRGVSRQAWYVLAACALVVAGAVMGWQTRGQHRDVRASATIATYTTGPGQRATIALADGSTVALNVASRLEVPADYAAGNRTIRLSGQALFTVIRHDGAPFTVVAGAATARVLGTSFVVRKYPTDAATTVAVRDGKVAVRTVVLTAAQQASVSSAGAVQVRPADRSQFDFTRGVLTITGRRLPDAIPELDRWYDADIRLGDASLADQRVTGGFTAGSLADLSAILQLMFDVRVVRSGRTLTLYTR